jgi:hypothetical protein
MNKMVLVIVGAAVVLGALWYGGVFDGNSPPSDQDTASVEQNKASEEITGPASTPAGESTEAASPTEETPATLPVEETKQSASDSGTSEEGSVAEEKKSEETPAKE